MKRWLVVTICVLTLLGLAGWAGTRYIAECGNGSSTEICFAVYDSTGNTLVSISPTQATFNIPITTKGAYSVNTTMGTLPAPLSGTCTFGANGTSMNPALGFQCFGMAGPLNFSTAVNDYDATTITNSNVVAGNVGVGGTATVYTGITPPWNDSVWVVDVLTGSSGVGVSGIFTLNFAKTHTAAVCQAGVSGSGLQAPAQPPSGIGSSSVVMGFPTGTSASTGTHYYFQGSCRFIG